MSAPDTNIEKQKRKHSAPLSGIGIAAIAAAVFFVAWLVWAGYAGNTPGEDDEMVAPENAVSPALQEPASTTPTYQTPIENGGGSTATD